MNSQGALHHALGIASLCLKAALVYAAVIVREAEAALLLIILAFAPGYYGIRYIRGLRRRTR